MNDDPLSSDVPPLESRSSPPAGSTIEILEDSPDRLVLFIPAGGKRGWELGCFGLIWITIISIITAAMVHGLGQPGGPEASALLFLAPFWLAGLLMLYFSLKMRHTRTLVLIEPARGVLQQTFFGRTKTRETALTAGEPATLVESYRQNDVPIDAVCLQGDPRPLKFGTPLEHKEKAWIVDRINAFLGVTPTLDADDPLAGPMPTLVFPEQCTACGGSLPPAEEGTEEATCPICGELNKARMQLVQTGPSDTQAAVGDFPSDRVRISEQSSDILQFEMRMFDNEGMRRGAGFALGIFALLWNGFVVAFVWGILFGRRFNPGSLIMIVFTLPFILVGLALAAAPLFIWAGRLRVQLDRNALAASWGIGPLRYRRSLATDMITHVTVENSPLAVKNQRPRSRTEDTRTALVWASERWIPITMLQGVNDARHVAEIVRQQLADMGFHVSDRRIPVVTSTFPDDEDDDDDDEMHPGNPDEAGNAPQSLADDEFR